MYDLELFLCGDKDGADNFHLVLGFRKIGCRIWLIGMLVKTFRSTMHHITYIKHPYQLSTSISLAPPVDETKYDYLGTIH